MKYRVLAIGNAQIIAQALSARQGKMAEFVDWIEGISVNELGKLVTALEDRLGVGIFPDWIGSSSEMGYDSRRAAKALSQGGSWAPDDYGKLLMAKKHGSKSSYRNPNMGNYNLRGRSFRPSVYQPSKIIAPKF